jgi:hypothetical protein
VHSENDDSGVDTTPYQHDFCVNKISKTSNNGPIGALSEDNDGTWLTPSALKKGHSFGGRFKSNMGKDSNLESEYAERGMRERGECNTTTNVVCHIRSKFGSLFINLLILI